MIQTFISIGRGISFIIGGLLSVLLVIYQWLISPVLHMLAPGCGCRFYPTCSQYAREAVVEHGPFKGSWLTLRRLGRCHPLGDHGFDPVPLKTNSQKDGCAAHSHCCRSSDPKVTHG